MVFFTFGGKSRWCDSPNLELLKNHIAENEGVPCESQLLLLDGRLLTELNFKIALSSAATVHLLLRNALSGGKGGFGSLLRGGGGSINGKRTTNFDACRDLQGRRLRHVNNAARLQEWMAQEHKVDYKELMAQYKAIKDGTSLTRQMCKWGDDCRYTYKCRFTHPADLRKEEEEKVASQPVVLGKEFGSGTQERIAYPEEDMRDAVQLGLKRARASSASASALVTAPKNRKIFALSHIYLEDGLVSVSAPAPASAARLWPSSEGSWSLSARGASLLSARRRQVTEALAAASSASAASAATSAASAPAAPAATAAASASASSAASRGLAVGPGAVSGVSAPTGEDMPVVSAASMAATLASYASLTTPTPASSASAAAASAASAAASASATPAVHVSHVAMVDLGLFTSEADMAARMDAAQLKSQLTLRGLKCGGTFAERSARLWQFRNTPLHQVPKKFLASNK